MPTTNPMQPVVVLDGVARFRANAIVRYMLDAGREAGVFDLNTLAVMEFSQQDREQLAQLIGYSVAGYHELSYVSDESAKEASKLASALIPGAGGCRDEGCEIHSGVPTHAR